MLRALVNCYFLKEVRLVAEALRGRTLGQYIRVHALPFHEEVEVYTFAFHGLASMLLLYRRNSSEKMLGKCRTIV